MLLFGELMDTMIRSMVRYRVRIPRELVLLSKQMLYLEGAASTLAPDMDLLQEQNTILQQQLDQPQPVAVVTRPSLRHGEDRRRAGYADPAA